MPVRAILAGVAAILLLLGGLGRGQEDEHSPELLLSAKLLRRLQRDRTRQTVRWMNFESRVQSTPESPERGFELALYYAVTQDPQRGKEAVKWALAHKAETRQVALVLDWVRNAMSPDEEQQLKQVPVPAGTSAGALRDALFLAIERDSLESLSLAQGNEHILEQLRNSQTSEPQLFYAAVEYLMALRAVKRVDLRSSDPAFFRDLPKAFLLGMTPNQVERPPFMAHASALAMVTLDPNLESSQFLQGWAMEGDQMLREGQGVAYELLWADPYLPGIAYQNMDPWVYQPAGRLFARVGWNADSCWISVNARRALNERNCTNGFLDHPKFGTLTLFPISTKCVAVPARTNNTASMVWKLPPATRLVYEHDGKQTKGAADPAGMWLVPNEAGGKVCLASGSHG